MVHYIVEVWRCENGRSLFEPLATNDLSITYAPYEEGTLHTEVFHMVVLSTGFQVSQDMEQLAARQALRQAGA